MLRRDYGETLWSEKTTVCRIFNCKRAFEASELPAFSCQLQERRLRGELHPQTCLEAFDLPSPFVPFSWKLAAGSGKRALSGEYRARTGDLLVANQALSQLS
jgi:hypothetical protein